MTNSTDTTGEETATTGEETATTGEQIDGRPLLFISHKHLDAELAAVVKDWIEERTAGAVRVYLSSDAASEGPGIGLNLDDELQKALWDAGVVLLLYTRGDYDWSYCMYECGVATDPKSPDTRVFVLQCGEDVPSPFADKVRVRASPEEIHKFAVSLLTQDDFFRGHKALTPFDAESERVTKAGADLYNQMKDQLPEKKSRANQWSTWPHLTIELDQATVEAIREEPSEKRLDVARETLLAEGQIVNATAGAAMLFGRNEIEDGLAVSDLVDEWRSENPDRPLAWLDCICVQLIAAAARKKASVARWEAMREVGGDGRHLIGAGAVESLPATGTMRFKFHFFEHSTARQVTSVMTRIAKIEKIDLDKVPANERLLQELLENLESRGWNRVPIVADGDQLRYIVHVSMIDKFIRRRAFNGDDIAQLTLEDLLADAGMAEMFESTFAVVNEDATVLDANEAMDSLDNCEDVFVTKAGSTEEPVIGWLTDHEIAEALDASLG